MEKHLHAKWVSILRSFVLLATAFGLAAGAVSCNTVKGVGRDVRSVGRSVEDVGSGGHQ